MEYQHIRVDRSDALATITVAREKQLNALSPEVLDELLNAVAELELDDDVRVVSLTGAGEKAFVAGADISAMQELSPREAMMFAQKGANLAHAIENSPTPYIAAVNGYALGGGCELALACDFIYASERAKFGQPEVKIGVIPGFGGTQRLARRVGVAKAKELIFTGEPVDAAEALRIGLADRVVPAGELSSIVEGTARQIAANAPLAISEAKRVIHEGQSMNLEHGITLEIHAFATLFGTADQREGMRAFLDKRAPTYRGE